MTAGRGFDFIPSRLKISPTSGPEVADDSPQAARCVREEVPTAIRALIPFPNVGHKRRDLTSRPLRFIVVREYLIAYAPEEKPLWVVAVMHGRRNPRVMAAIPQRQRISTHSAPFNPAAATPRYRPP